MQKCQDSYYATFTSYPRMLDYHREQAKNSQWKKSQVKLLGVEPLDRSSPLFTDLSAFAAGTSQEAVQDTACNLGLAMRVDGELYPVRMTAYKSLLDRAKTHFDFVVVKPCFAIITYPYIITINVTLLVNAFI